jgi:hypothetical protein
MVHDLIARLGRSGAGCVLGIPKLTLDHWLNGYCRPSAAATRAVWLTWIIVLHPDRVRCVGDIITWGRFKIERRLRAKPVGWSGWSI